MQGLAWSGVNWVCFDLIVPIVIGGNKHIVREAGAADCLRGSACNTMYNTGHSPGVAAGR